MRKSKFTESQIVATPKQVDGGRQVKDVCRELGISDATYYVWKSKYGGMEAADVQRLRDLETEHSQAQAHVRRARDGKPCTEGCHRKKAVDPAHKRPLLAWLIEQHGWSERRACRWLAGAFDSALSASSRSGRGGHCAVVRIGRTLSRAWFRKALSDHPPSRTVWNHKRVWRVYCLMKLNQRRRGRRRVPTGIHTVRRRASSPTPAASIDFMSDALWDGRRFRTFNVIDDFSREALGDRSRLNLPAARVIRTLERIAAWRGYPGKLRLDNGPEFVALALAEWAERKSIALGPHRARPADAERFHRTIQWQLPARRARHACLPQSHRSARAGRATGWPTTTTRSLMTASTG